MDDPTTTTIITDNGGSGGGIKRLRSPTQKKSGRVPPWVKVMINIMQYKDCPIHSDVKDNKLDRFCIDCLGSFCNKCSSNHLGHKYIKIRRYVYCDVINRPDFQKHFDCSGIQGYVTNRTKVLFLKQRGANQRVKEQQHQQQNSRDHSCIICNQSLTDSCYCSIQCKVSAMYTTANTEDAMIDYSVTENKSEGADDGLHDAKGSPTLIPFKRKRLRKGFPHRAPLF